MKIKHMHTNYTGEPKKIFFFIPAVIYHHPIINKNLRLLYTNNFDSDLIRVQPYIFESGSYTNNYGTYVQNEIIICCNLEHTTSVKIKLMYINHEKKV